MNNLKGGDNRNIENEIKPEKYTVDEHHSYPERKVNLYRTVK
jgi:hypothetical protein